MSINKFFRGAAHVIAIVIFLLVISTENNIENMVDYVWCLSVAIWIYITNQGEN